ncbi:DUF6913 domain-containing protein [Parapedobacter sp. DT-150]|uniref:DUF6913 domain-containing protein n=1 Tax=Parapedobacter sp. DT-150 TaxID=3396162 RepID=UPI003F1A794D
MNSLEKLRWKAGKMTLYALLNRQRTEQATLAYQDIKRIALLTPLLHGEADIAWLGDVYNRLVKDGKECVVVSFSAVPIDIPADLNLIVLGPDALKWNFIPKEDVIKSFISINFDLLLNLCADDGCLALDYLALRQQATLRIGRHEPRMASAYGIMVKGNFADGKELLKAIKLYLGKLY